MAAYLELGEIPAELLPKPIDPEILKAVSQIKIYKPQAPVMTTRPTPRQTTQASQEGFFDRILNFVDRTVDKGSTILDKVGQAKAKINTIKTRADAGVSQWESDWRKNIIETPRDTRNDWITGVPNGLIIAGAAGLGILLLLVSRKGE